MQKRKTTFFIGGFVLLLLVFTFADLSISKALFNIESPYGIFFAAFGETPGVLVGLFSAAALIITRDKTQKISSVAQIIGFGLMTVLLGLMAGAMPLNYLKVSPIIAVMAPIYIVLAFYCAHRIAKADPKALRQAAKMGLYLMLAAMVIINIIKIFWGRPRMRIMDNPASQFTYWFLPQGIAASDQYKSFPSGHSANAACIIWITMLPTFLPKLRTRKAFITLNAVAYVWTVMVMLSRIIMGAHFATDVLMGASITVASFYLLKRLMFKEELALQRA